MKFSKINVLALFFAFSNVFASQLVCENLDYKFSYINVDTSFTTGVFESRTDAPITCENVQSIASVFKELSEIATAAGLPIVEGDVGLSIFNEDDNASFSQVEFNIPVKFWYGKIHERHPKHVKAVWAHEYGHYVFAKNLAKSSAKYAALFKDLVGKANLQVQKNKMIFEFMEKYGFSMEEIGDVINLQQYVLARHDDDLNVQYDLLMHKITRLERKDSMNQISNMTDEEFNNLKEAKEIQWVFDALHEFFADTMAVVYTGEGDCITNSLYNLRASTDKERKYATYRDFTNSRNKLSRINFETVDIYTVFAPLRAHLWNRYLSRPMFAKSSSEVLGKVFEAISNALPEVMSDGVLEMDNSNNEGRIAQAVALNRIFIYYLDQLLVM